MMRVRRFMRALSLAGALLVLSGLTAGAQNPSGSANAHEKLPAGSGREVMIRVCSECHDPEVAADQQLDLAGWKSLVDEMASKGAEATDAELDEIVHYLANAFPVSK